jgi:MFS family permease
MGGRFILGLGAALASAAGPAYIVELAHPAYRGTMAGMYNNFWWFGNILAGWTTYGTNLNITSSWAWRIPTAVQAGLPAVVMVLILFFPESPRWLIAHDRQEEALRVFAKYHGDGDEQSPIVQLEYQEILDQLHTTRDDNPWWDFRELGMIKQAGILDPNKQLLINAINPIFSMLAAVWGATLLDKLGRRFMMLAGLGGGLFAYILLTAFTAQAEVHANLSYAVIVAIFLFGVCFAWGFTPLQTLYAVECLENRTRAKGSGLNFLFLNVAMVVNTYGISVGIEAIGWKLYLVYIGWICVELVVIYFFFVETAGKTLEEMGDIFAAKNPRKESTKKTKMSVDAAGNVLEIGGDTHY